MTDEQTQEEVPVEVAETQEVAEIEVPEVKESESEKNWKMAHEAMSQQKREIELLKQQLHQQQRPPEVEKDEFEDLDPQEYLTVAKARDMATKLAKKQAQEAARSAIQEYSQQQTLANDEEKARAKYEDYDYVIEKYAKPMINNDPAIAHKIMQSRNPAQTAYKLAKLEANEEVEKAPAKPLVAPEKVLKNAKRPVSANAVGNSLQAQADQYSKMSKDDIWTQSQKYAKQV
jgi:hypothetical protein